MPASASRAGDRNLFPNPHRRRPCLPLQRLEPFSKSPQSIVDPQVTRPPTPPQKFKINKFKNDGISPTSVVVPTSTTDEQLKSLIWFFREKVRSHDFKSLG